MDKFEIKTERLKLAQIRHFSKAHNGVEVPRNKAYVFLYKLGEDKYVNLFNTMQELPVYERVPYSNTTKEGLDYGTKIVLASGEEKSGPCFVVENIGMDNLFGEEKISLEQLKQFVFASNLFFIDRPTLVEEKVRGKSPIDRFVAFDKKYREDKKKAESFQQYLNTCVEEERYCK